MWGQYLINESSSGLSGLVKSSTHCCPTLSKPLPKYIFTHFGLPMVAQSTHPKWHRMASVFPGTLPCYPNELLTRKLHSGPATRPAYQSCLWNPVPKEFLFGTFWTRYRIGWGISLESLKSKLLGGVLFSNLLHPAATSCHTPSTYGPWQSEQLPKDRNAIQTWTSADDRHLSRKALLRSFQEGIVSSFHTYLKERESSTSSSSSSSSSPSSSSWSSSWSCRF